MSIIIDVREAKETADEWHQLVWATFKAYRKDQTGEDVSEDWTLEDYVVQKSNIDIYVTIDTSDCGADVSFRYFSLPHEFFDLYHSEGDK